MIRIIACTLMFAVAVPAAAESRVVRYDDLNLTSAAGIKTFERRLDGAARWVCGANQDYRQSLHIQAITKKCIADAKTRARADFAARGVAEARGG